MRGNTPSTPTGSEASSEDDGPGTRLKNEAPLRAYSGLTPEEQASVKILRGRMMMLPEDEAMTQRIKMMVEAIRRDRDENGPAL